MALNIIEVANKVFALGIIALQVFIALTVLYILLPYKKAKMLLYNKSKISEFFSKHGIEFAFLIALAATAGSLFYSEYAGFVPCSLCWFQRVFLYPEVILLGLAWLKKDDGIIEYGLVFSLIGLAISLYDNYIYYTSTVSSFCTATAPCTVPYVTEFNYVTIPMMALTTFALISLFLIIKQYSIRKKIYEQKF